MKIKDDKIKVMKRCCMNIADLKAIHNLVAVMQDNAYEYRSEEIMCFLDLKGIRSHCANGAMAE